MMKIKISAKSAKMDFIPCGPECHSLGCEATCCDYSAGPARVSVHASEEAGIKALGAKVKDGMIVPTSDGKCPFKDGRLCSLFGEPERPLGCVVSPFQLMKHHDTLIIRNRYKKLTTHKRAQEYPHLARPAYEAFRDSLVVMFGEQQTADIIEQVKLGVRFPYAEMNEHIYAIVKGREATYAAKKAA